MELEFSGEIWYWKGPAPFYFVTVPEEECLEIKDVSAAVTYGWGMIPTVITIGETTWKTSLWPKNGRYIVPIRDHVRKAEDLEEGQEITVGLVIELK